MDLDRLINSICKRFNFRHPRTAQYYLLYNGILFNTSNIKDTAKMLINKLLNEIANIQELSRSPIHTKKITHHNSDIHIRLRQSLNNWAFIETSARIAVIRALSMTLISNADDDYRFIRTYIDNLVRCLHEHEHAISRCDITMSSASWYCFLRYIAPDINQLCIII
jgi:hypothetical protein